MPKGYHHLSYEQRCQIYVLLKRRITQKDIAYELGCSQSTIGREVRRNRGRRGYRYKQAQAKADSRKKQSNNVTTKLNAQMIEQIKAMLYQYQWSPEQISGKLKREEVNISHETIYRYIWQDKRCGGVLYKQLRNKGKKYHKRSSKTAGRGLIPNRVGIEKRPEIVDQKIRVGDWELDTIVGAKHRGAIVSIVDRVTKFTRLVLVKSATAKLTARAIISSLSSISEHVHTLTSDNGKEFALHRNISRDLQAGFYFARPYHSWERGLNENTNRLVRQYFQKGTDFTTLKKKDVQNVEYLLNTRPRKTLNFNNPIEEFYHRTGQDLKYALAC